MRVYLDTYCSCGYHDDMWTGNWVDDDKCDGYLLKKYPDGDYFFGDTKMFVYQTFMQYKLGNKIYIGDTQLSSTKREGYGETTYSDGNVEKGIYINSFQKSIVNIKDRKFFSKKNL